MVKLYNTQTLRLTKVDQLSTSQDLPRLLVVVSQRVGGGGGGKVSFTILNTLITTINFVFSYAINLHMQTGYKWTYKYNTYTYSMYTCMIYAYCMYMYNVGTVYILE